MFGTRGWGMAVVCCHTFLLIHLHCSNVGSLPQDAVPCELLQHGSFPCLSTFWKNYMFCIYKVQSIRNRMLQCRTPVVCDYCWKTCSSTGSSPQAFQEPAAAWAVHKLQFPLGHIHLLCHGLLHRLQHEYLLWYGPLWAARGQLASPLSSLQGNFFSHTWSTSFPSFLSDLGVCRAVLLTFLFFNHSSLTQLLCSVNFLSMLSQRHHRHHWWVQLWPAVGPFWNQPALGQHGEQFLVSSQRCHPRSPSTTKTLLCKPNRATNIT